MKFLEASLQENTLEELEKEYLETKRELVQRQKREETHLSQQAKKKWLNEGDNNTKFFHVSTAQKRRSLRIENMLLSNVTVLSSPKDVHDAVVDYFQNFLTDTHTEPLSDLSEYTGEVVSSDEGDQLCKTPTEDEVREVIVSIPMDSSPGPVGFSFAFYIKCWNIIKKDVVEATCNFLSGNSLPRFYSSSYIVLIPKVKNPQGFDNFQPISLCSVAYKIFSIILVNKWPTRFLKFYL